MLVKKAFEPHMNLVPQRHAAVLGFEYSDEILDAVRYLNVKRLWTEIVLIYEIEVIEY